MIHLDTEERLEVIAARVRLEKAVKIAVLATELDVSEMTIRRDLELLASQGVVQRVRGGARAVGPETFSERFGQHARAKDRIVRKLAPLIGEGGAIGVDASTTLQRLASVIGQSRDITVLTNGPDLFTALQSQPGVTPLLTGGQLDGRTGSLVGPLAIRSTRDFLLRRLFVSAAGIDADHGTTEVTLEEADVKLAMADAASEIVVALDHTKLGQRGSARCLDIDRIDVLVTDLDPADQRLEPYRRRCRLI
ncbi:MAG: DeoR/GlpR family DNA-binding transcription regulator [Actinomycetota bacterium]|nr:DeoR/GlpR family DNA-binding transcription regulator [Actinomycetota bacterium]